MIGINGIINYSTARIDGKIFVDNQQDIVDIQQRITDINYDGITDTTIINNNLEVLGNYHSVNGNINLDNGSLNITNGAVNVTSLGLTGNLLLYDKSSPIKYPYTFKTVGKNLELHYNDGTDYKIYQVSFDSLSNPQIEWFYNNFFNSNSLFYQNVFIDNNKKIYLGDLTGSTAGSISYNTTSQYLSILSGLNGGSMRLQTNDSLGTAYIIDITSSLVSIPQPLNLSSLLTSTGITNNGNYTSPTGNIELTSGALTVAGKTILGNGALIAPTSTVSTRDFNVVSTGGGIKLARADGVNAPFIEMDNWNTNYTLLNNRCGIFGGTSTDERMIFRFRNTDFDVLTLRRATTNISNNVDIAGNLNVTGSLTAGGLSFTNLTVTGTTTTGNLVVNTAINGNASNQLPINCDVAIGDNYGILQNSTNTTINNFCRSLISSGLGQSSQAGLQIKDTANNKNLYILPNASLGAYNSTTNTNDVTLVAASGTAGSTYMNLTVWSTTATGIRIEPTRTTISSARINYEDGTIGYSAGDRFSMGIVEDMNFLKNISTCKSATFDIQSVAASLSTQATNRVQMGIVSVYRGEIYTGIFFYASAAGITFRCAMYDIGANGSRLNHRTTNYTSIAGINFCPFDATNQIAATKYVCIMLVPTNTTHSTYIYSATNINWGNTAAANTINLVGCYYSGFSAASGFPATFTGITPTAFGSKFFMGVY